MLAAYGVRYLWVPAGTALPAVSRPGPERDGAAGTHALERAFERFYSLPRPAGGSRSSGLGLCFAAEAAALHGGESRLANRPGGGACFTFSLPASKEPPTTSELKSPEAAGLV